jgi:hypothetical protein
MEANMLDILYLLLVILFFAASAALVEWLERLHWEN